MTEQQLSNLVNGIFSFLASIPLLKKVPLIVGMLPVVEGMIDVPALLAFLKSKGVVS